MIPNPKTDLKLVYKGIREGHVVVVGQTKYGKTTAAKHFFMNDHIFDGRSKPIYIFLDTKHDDAVLGMGFLVDDLDELAYHIETGSRRIVYRPPGTSERKKHLNAIVDLMFHHRSSGVSKNAPFMLVVDEIQLYARKQENNEGLERLSTTGAGKNIHGVFLGQRLQDIHEQTLSQCNTTLVFHMRERADYLRSRGLEELISWMPWLRDNRYHFALDYDGKWELYQPVPYNSEKHDVDYVRGIKT